MPPNGYIICSKFKPYWLSCLIIFNCMQVSDNDFCHCYLLWKLTHFFSNLYSFFIVFTAVINLGNIYCISKKIEESPRSSVIRKCILCFHRNALEHVVQCMCLRKISEHSASGVEVCTHKAEQMQSAALCWKMASTQISPWKVDQMVSYTDTSMRCFVKEMDRFCEEMITQIWIKKQYQRKTDKFK